MSFQQRRQKTEIFMTPTTSEQSLVYMRNLTVGFISHICYLRKLFPAKTFDVTKVGSREIRTFNRDKTDSQLNEIIRSLSIGIEKSAIETISLNVNVGGQVLESYTISMKEVQDIVDKDDLQMSVERSFHNLERAVGWMDEVPSDGTISFSVTSQKDKWGPSSQDTFHETEKRKIDLTKYKIGKVNTGFHGANLTMRRAD
ncbi:uncharacterized protein LOC111057412 [Nilaparvata lugens]|uniref:uncharacterized protein LOC111057412 n=1 Tax=Nilaparvata lugens TaxID=108931 RepID=UPI00193EA99D|nr:uncharacterized protein LOC111057412 [Nilaparvata lugens]XP_039281561.1 uncharacterized protein LOC111057412 [Nilaparvata lugens]